MDHLRLPGAKFVLMDACGNELMCGITNENGELIFDCLPYGKYYVKELEAPCGFEKSNECFEVIVCDDCYCRRVEVVNRQKRGCIKVVKIGC